MSLQIRQTFAEVGINIRQGRLDIETQNAELMLQQKHGKIVISTEPAAIKIDQEACFESAGIKDAFVLTKELAEQGRQQVKNYIKNKLSAGRRLAAIYKGGNAIVDIVKNKYMSRREYGLGFIPKAGPEISATKGELKIEAEKDWEGTYKGVKGVYIAGDTQINYVRGKVDIYLKQKPSVNIFYIGENVDTYL